MYGALILFEDEFIHIVAISFTALILTELIMVALTIRRWHILMVLAELVSLGLYILTLVISKDYFGKHSVNLLDSQSQCSLTLNVVQRPPGDSKSCTVHRYNARRFSLLIDILKSSPIET